MSYSGPVITIFQHGNWQLDSYGNGAAYRLINHASKRSAFFQGDDATTLRDDFDKADEIGADHVCRILCDYSDVMLPDNICPRP